MNLPKALKMGHLTLALSQINQVNYLPFPHSQFPHCLHFNTLTVFTGVSKMLRNL
jgi:hypothetical protein